MNESRADDAAFVLQRLRDIVRGNERRACGDGSFAHQRVEALSRQAPETDVRRNMVAIGGVHANGRIRYSKREPVARAPLD